MPRSGGRSAATFRQFQRGAVTWREKRAHVFSKVRTHQHASWQPSVHRLIVHYILVFFIYLRFIPMRLAWLGFVVAGRIGRGVKKKNTVRNRDTSLKRTEKSLGLYIVAWGTDDSKQKT